MVIKTAKFSTDASVSVYWLCVRCQPNVHVFLHFYDHHFSSLPACEGTQSRLSSWLCRRSCILCFSLPGGHLAAGSGFRAAEDSANDRGLDSISSGSATKTRGDREPAQCNETHTSPWSESCDLNNLMSRLLFLVSLLKNHRNSLLVFEDCEARANSVSRCVYRSGLLFMWSWTSRLLPCSAPERRRKWPSWRRCSSSWATSATARRLSWRADRTSCRQHRAFTAPRRR